MPLDAGFRELDERAELLVLQADALRGGLQANLQEAARAIRPAGELVRKVRTVLSLLAPVLRLAAFVRDRRKRAALRASRRDRA